MPNSTDAVVQTLVDKLQGPAREVYSTCVHQEIVYGLVGLVALVVAGLLLALVSWKLFPYLVRGKKAASTYSEDSWSIGIACFYAAWIIYALITLFLGSDCVMHLLNPQYYALRDLLQSVRG